jgi:hypothetical protein
LNSINSIHFKKSLGFSLFYFLGFTFPFYWSVEKPIEKTGKEEKEKEII